MYRILMIDDDREVLKLNQRFFAQNNCLVKTCADARFAIHLLEVFKPECILLDVLMPGLDGYQLCRQIRNVTDVPILFLSGRVSEEDKIQGFLCGADDYIEKPYSLREVYVRIIANIRRHQAASGIPADSCMEITPLLTVTENQKVLYMEKEIPLSRREYELLLFMAKRPNEEVSFEEIGTAIWGTYTQEDRRTVMVYVSRLRKKLGNYSGLENLIETVWSKGYKLVGK